MLYPVYIHMGNKKTAHGVMFPDFPGCFSAADAWEQIPAAIQEAVEAHFADGEPIPKPTCLEVLTKQAEYQGGVWMMAEVDLSKVATKPQRLNISLPENLVVQIDTMAKARHMTRSAFLAKAAMREIELA